MTARRRARWAAVLAVAAGLWLLVADASAQGLQRLGPGRNAGADRAQRMVPAERRPERLSADEAEPRDRGQRLSPEERRQLRRDVHEAGRDLYPNRMRPGRREWRRE